MMRGDFFEKSYSKCIYVHHWSIVGLLLKGRILRIKWEHGLPEDLEVPPLKNSLT